MARRRTEPFSCATITRTTLTSDLTMRPMIRRLCLAALTALACTPALAQLAPTGQPQLDLPRTQLSIGMHRIDTQLATTPAQRQIGLMHRSAMPAGEGMLFIFEQPGVQCFWMRNTLIPLSAAFLDDEGRIVNIEDMKPQTEDSHCSAKPVRYVLEMNQGWFAKRGIKAGTKLGGAPFKQ